MLTQARVQEFLRGVENLRVLKINESKMSFYIKIVDIMPYFFSKDFSKFWWGD